jgi:hypothetical protein
MVYGVFIAADVQQLPRFSAGHHALAGASAER